MRTYSKPSLAALATSMIVAAGAHGATITPGGADHLIAGDVADNYTISVNGDTPGYANVYGAGSNAAYLGNSIEGSFNGTVVAYHFVNVTGGSGARTLTTVVESGGIIAKMTSTDESDNNGFDSFQQNRADIFTTTDPVNLLIPEASRNNTAGIRDLDDFTGTVDISGLAAGSIYIFSGGYNGGAISITATMTDTEAIEGPLASGELLNGIGASPVGGQNIYATRIDFVNDAGYDTITYTSNGSRLVGAVVTEVVPEPGSLALLGLGGLLIARRRRA